jgi:hypothetical protein
VTKFKYLGTIVINKKCIEEEIKSILDLCNACQCSVSNTLSFRLLSKNIKFRMCRPIILILVLYGCETLSLTLIKEKRLRLFEKRVLRRIFGPKDKIIGGLRKLHIEVFHDFYYKK